MISSLFGSKKVITVVQARLGSSRLPVKVLMPIIGKTVLEHQLERMSHSSHCGEIIVATSDKSADDPIEKLCHELGYTIFRGSELDLLDRHYHCAVEHQADIVAKIPSDCPLIDYRIIDEVFQRFAESDYDFVSNLHPASYPDGNDCEVFTFQALERSFHNAKKDYEREHTTPYMWENPAIFALGNVQWHEALDLSMSHRFTIDYIEDFQFISRVFEELYPMNPTFSVYDILDLLAAKTEIYSINQSLAGVNWYRHHIDELKTVRADQTRNKD